MFETAGQLSRVIAIEEHVWTAGLRSALLELGGDETINWSNQQTTNRQLLDVGEERLARMDAMGVDFQVLSITAPGTQQLPPALAVPLARDANDFLADAVRRRPDRFAAFATLPTPAPEAAAEELRRCVDELDFVGAMLFPRTGEKYLDHTSHRPIFEAAAELDVPLYIHPGLPIAAVRDACYSGFSPSTNLMLATGGWGWHAEAGLTALRLILAGTFDRHPSLQLVLGHMGEIGIAPRI
ncbi:amidohydrolase family protein [Caballeronia sp. LZ043]|uniref:amidohydrolase family protein n=1 Tax=Caballeronia sp. LZ043 TaxID=3038569 RepID=UPI00285F3723|nr:amidohydrolase family protein [Caballeronia sp. LZ043]MDR5822353.1 amidohydrolase family protein [Caballeronia sp. LZ043]